MATYEFSGEKYKKASRHQKEWGESLISKLKLGGDERILDLGCGDGALTEHLASLVPRGCVIGIDASEGMIETAKKCEAENLKFVRMDINDMSFENEFDVIFSNAALHWIKDHKKLLENTYAALKPGGEILWNFAGDGNCSNFFEVVKEKMKDKRFERYFADFEWPWYMPSKVEYERLTKASGFTEIVAIEENRDRYFADADEMIRWIDQPSLVPFIGCVPDGLKSAFREEVIEEMIGRTKRPDGTCFETFRRINVGARK